MNIAHRIRSTAHLFPEKKSVVFAEDNSFYTFREFEEKSNQMALRLQKLGINRGMRTLLFVRPCLDFSVLTFALFKLGAVPVLIDPGMGLKNLLNSVAQVKPDALVSVGLVHWIRRLRPEHFKTIKVKISLERVGGKTHFLYQNLDHEDKEFTPVEVSSSDLAAILFTSGGTGIPKGVLYTHGILNTQTDLLQKMFNLNHEETDLPGFPLFALFTLAMGMTSVIPRMDPTKPALCNPEKIVNDIIKYQVTFAAGSPAIWERVGRFCVNQNIQLPSLKYVVMFGAPVRAQIHQMFQKVLINGDTFTPYGATECLPVSLISGSEILQNHLVKMQQGLGTCIGKAVAETEIKIIKTSDIPEMNLNFINSYEPGEIIVKGKQVTPAYFDMKDETLKAKIQIGNDLWHRMGDIGWLDEDQRLWFLGRKSHRVESTQGVFYPIQVESIFNQYPLIRRCALVSVKIRNEVVPALVIERWDKKINADEDFKKELLKLKISYPFTNVIQNFFLKKDFPVDVRHNIKIDRIKLSFWAQQKLQSRCHFVL